MHPAPSIILFTTLSGLGFGLLAYLGLGFPPVTGGVAFVFFALAFLMAVGGLLASAFHLGHPERALKAFTQWRSSWLSREAWLSSATLAVMALYAAAAVFAGATPIVLGVAGAALAMATVYATSMIYTQLRTVPRWHQAATPILFLAYAIAGGALLSGQVRAAVPLLIALGAVQLWAWHAGDRALAASGTTLGTATGLGGRGTVRAFEPPHTGTNYLLTEMVHVVGRRHAVKLRVIGFLLAVVLPCAILGLMPFHHALAALAILCHVAGALVCRWLFFAEAEHVVGLYYGKRAAA